VSIQARLSRAAKSRWAPWAPILALVVANLVVDILYSYLDPHIRLG